MVSVRHAVDRDASAPPIELLAEGMTQEEQLAIERALAFAEEAYAGRVLGTGEPIRTHALGCALIAASLRLDVDARIAALLFSVESCIENARERVEADFGSHVARLVSGLRKLSGLQTLSRAASATSAQELHAQNETLRKMLLAMVEDIRVVLLRLASRVQTLRFYADTQDVQRREDAAREAMNIYAPLANRLGVWQLKWELEDLSLRFLEPETYKSLAKMLDERRSERERFIQESVERLRKELSAVGIQAEIYGRPKHIYSIYNKMRSKKIAFSEVYDIRALRVLVEDVRACYAALDVVHQIWKPIHQEYDDYISRPKGNNYQSLHTAVLAGDGRALEVQVRTYEMHRHAELGVAAHWRYKEGMGIAGSEYDNKIALLRNLLSWRDEVASSSQWVEEFKLAALGDTVYILTPQGKVIDLPRGSTPVDFAYRLHTDLGHRCRGAKVDGHLVPLNTRLENGQTVEISTTKEGGPSRDWLDPRQAYVASVHAKRKIRQYFGALEEEELHARAPAPREPARETKPAEEPKPEIVVSRSKAGDSSGKVLIVGVGNLLTSLSRCCKPAPPDAIKGFVTRGRGVSIHRADCRDFCNLAKQHPERVIVAEWGEQAYNSEQSTFAVDISVQAMDRQGLLRDISEALLREKLSVTAVNTQSKKNMAYMNFTLEVGGIAQLQRALTQIREVKGVLEARRG